MDAFPDLKVFLDYLLFKSDIVEYHWTLSGTSTGPGGSGNPVRISGFESWTFDAEGLIAKSIGTFDAVEYERQLKFGAAVT